MSVVMNPKRTVGETDSTGSLTKLNCGTTAKFVIGVENTHASKKWITKTAK